MPSEPEVLVSLYGALRLVCHDGHDLTPKSAKAQGLLALLATAPGQTRHRRWLQDKLWSDRGRDQGAGSLRQTLSAIRRSLGAHRDILLTNRQSITLDPQRVGLCERVSGDGSGHEFLEGLDIRDPEFEDWLRRERSARHTDPPAPPAPALQVRNIQRPPVVILQALSEPAGRDRLIEDLFLDNVALSLLETMSVEVRTEADATATPPQLRVKVQGFAAAGGLRGLRVQLLHCPTGALRWSGMQVGGTADATPLDDTGMMSLGNHLIDALADSLGQRSGSSESGGNANLLARAAMRKIFTMRPEELRAADSLLRDAYAIDPRGTFLAWRAQLRVIQSVERHDGLCAQTLNDEARDLSRRAIEAEPSNSVVLACLANSALVIDGDVESSRELARRSVQFNASNPLAWDSLSNVSLYCNDAECAHRFSIRAQSLGMRMPFKFWLDMGRCLTAIVTRRESEALTHAQMSGALAPDFHPPQRYALALHASAGDDEAVERTLNRLKKLESDFTLDRYINDDTYPVSLLRKTSILERDQLRRLI